jgi:hypothetical protein
MARVCGNQLDSEHRVLGDLHLGTTVCVVALCSSALLALSAPPVASSSAPRPHPESLWKQYPLNTARSGPSGASSKQNAPANRPRPRNTGTHSSGGHSLMWWFALAWGICLVAALVWGVAFVRMLRRRHASEGADGASESAARPESEVTVALREVLRARKEDAAPKLAAEPSLKLKQAASSTDQVEKLKLKSVRPSEKDVRKHEVSVLKAKLSAPGKAAAKGHGPDAGPREGRRADLGAPRGRQPGSVERGTRRPVLGRSAECSRSGRHHRRAHRGAASDRRRRRGRSPAFPALASAKSLHRGERRIRVEPTPGLEPGTPSLRVKCSTS